MPSYFSLYNKEGIKQELITDNPFVGLDLAFKFDKKITFLTQSEYKQLQNTQDKEFRDYINLP
ncbi:hypothetical protein ABSA28_01124 [Candidatus Hepatincolaceae symbiont of Richtersius coronifer]